MNGSEVICLESEALYYLVDTVVERIRDKEKKSRGEKWILPEKALQILGIRSKTTLQKLRDTGQIRFTQPMPKVILYDRDSLHEYLDKHVRETF